MRRLPLPLSDCEPVRATGPAQPVNTLTAIAFVGAGAWLWRRARTAASPALARTYAAAVAGVGVGSVASHGVGGPVAAWLHDVTLGLPLLTVAAGSAAAATGRSTHQALAATGVGTVAVSGVLAAAPSWGTAVTGGCALLAVLGIVTAPEPLNRIRSRAGVAFGVTLVSALPWQVWGRTDGPLCQAAVPAHGVWHVLAAVALAAAGSAFVEPLALADRPTVDADATTGPTDPAPRSESGR